MRELGVAGAIALVFGLGSFWATGSWGAFNAVNLAGGVLALLAALALSARRLRSVGGPHSRALVARGLVRIAAALVVGAAAERAADAAGWRFDWTREGSFEASEATCGALRALPGPVEASLFHDAYDPRKRRTRLLLETLARCGPLRVWTHVLDSAPELEDRFAVGSSNTVVLEAGGRFETVERPTEGALYEALARLGQAGAGRLLMLRGAGEGDPERGDALGFSGLAAALQTEGYEVAATPSAALRELPEGTAAVLAVAPRRPLPDPALAALRRYLERGGALVAFLEPGVRSGLEELLADYGLESPDLLIVDPASAALEELAEGAAVLAYHYETHPVTRGLDSNRMTFFPGARSFELRRPGGDDAVKRLVLASPRSWLSPDLSLLRGRRAPPPRDGARQDYHAIAAAGVYPRPSGSARIVAFGDSDFASNRALRTLYNADLALNAVHWAVEREAAIKILPKVRSTVQFPLPVENTLQTLYGVGLLVPELLLLCGALVWLRRRAA